MLICEKTFDQERALYNSRDVRVERCVFDGPADGESALKESSNISVVDSRFCLRYPFWHDRTLSVNGSELTETCRAALWYTEAAQITGCKLHGVKAVRECREIALTDCDIRSAEFGWFCDGLSMRNCSVESEYFLLHTGNVRLDNVSLNGKYSLQYVRDAVIEDCRLNTKDTLWHAKNVTVRNSVIDGAYLGWYSENVTFESCVFSGTQPFCYCKNLRLINCALNNADLAFEKSDVHANLTSPILSIKNPTAGRIAVPAVGAVIRDDPDSRCELVIG